MRYKVRNLVLVGLVVGTVGACGKPPAPPAGPPNFIEPSTGPTVQVTPPASAGPASPAATRATAAPETAKPATVKKVTYVFPVVGNASYAHVHHDYPATDVMAKCGTKVVAATSGTILAVVRTDAWSAKVNAGATRGGLSVSLLGDDGVRYYGSHLSAIDPAITVGAPVRAGQALGKVGDTGDASACHLHFGISPPCARHGDWWNQRGTIWPWPYLDSWRAGGSRSPVDQVKAWHSENGCPTKPRVDP